MRAFDSDDHAGELLSLLPGELAVHVVEVVFVFRSTHSGPDYVELGEHTGSGTIDDLVLEVIEVSPTRASGVDDGRNTVAQGEAVGVYREIACIGAAFSCSCVNVSM